MVLAIPAVPIDATHPGDAHPRSEGEAKRCAIPDLTNDLMTRNDPRKERRQVAFGDMQVGTADAASEHTDDDMAFQKVRAGNIDDLDEPTLFCLLRIVDGSF